MDIITTFISSLIDWYTNSLSYWVLTLLMILENSIVPLPAELIVAPAAYNAATGRLSFPIIILCTTFGSIVGAIINYYLSLFLGRELIYRFVDSRWGKLLMLDTEKLKQAEQFFLKRGKTATFIGRLIPVGRQLVSIPAGLARMPILTFILYTAIVSAIWNTLLASIGYFLAAIIPPEQLGTTVNKYSIEISIIFVAICVVYYIAKKFIKRKKSNQN